MFFLLLSQQKRRLRFRNLLWSSFIPSGSLMISPDPSIHNYTLLYGTIRFTKKERLSRSSPHLSDSIIISDEPDAFKCFYMLLCAFMCCISEKNQETQTPDINHIKTADSFLSTVASHLNVITVSQ